MLDLYNKKFYFRSWLVNTFNFMIADFFTWNLWLLLKIPALLFLILILFLVYKFGYLTHLQKKRFQAQGIPVVPFLGMNPVKDMKNLVDKYSDSVYPIKDAIKKHQDAKAMLIQLGPILALSLLGPEYIKDFNTKVTTDYDIMEPQKIFDYLMKNGIIGLNGEDWKLHRKILSDSFRFDLFEKNIADNYAATVEYFESLTAEDMKHYHPREHLKRVFSAITGQNFIGENVDKRLIDGKSALTYLFDLFDEMSKINQNPIVLMAGPKIVGKGLFGSHRRFLGHCKKFREFLLQIIQEKREHLEANPKLKGRNIIEGLIEAQKQYPDDPTLNDISIGGEFITLLFAGTDTTSALLGMTLYYLALYPDLVQELREEINKAIPDGKVTTISQLNSLELMHSTLKEVLRMHPPVPFSMRRAVHDTNILDIQIKKGDYVGLGITANDVNPKYWEDPEKFNPKRFMKGVVPANLEPFAFLTFSVGMRNCIGQHFAMIQAKLVLSTFLRMFDFKLKPDYKLQQGFKLLYEPMELVELILTRRT